MPCTAETDIDVRPQQMSSNGYHTRGRFTDFTFAAMEEKNLEGDKNKIKEVDTQAPNVHTAEHSKPSVPKGPAGSKAPARR